MGALQTIYKVHVYKILINLCLVSHTHITLENARECPIVLTLRAYVTYDF